MSADYKDLILDTAKLNIESYRAAYAAGYETGRTVGYREGRHMGYMEAMTKAEEMVRVGMKPQEPTP